MTVGNFTIETTDSTDEAYKAAYDNACHQMLDCLRERIPPWAKSPADSAVKLEKNETFYTFECSTPMDSASIEAIALEIAGSEQFRILQRPMNFKLLP